MTSFAILIKSHLPDRDYAARLLDSIRRYNVESIPVFVVVPPEDVVSFDSLAAGVATVLSESELSEHLVIEPVAGFSAGYINQEIVKLSFWELGLAENYLCADSDAEFIRPFTASDFMADANTPFTFLTEDADLRAEPGYFAGTWQTRAASRCLVYHTRAWHARYADCTTTHAVAVVC